MVDLNFCDVNLNEKISENELTTTLNTHIDTQFSTTETKSISSNCSFGQRTFAEHSCCLRSTVSGVFDPGVVGFYGHWAIAENVVAFEEKIAGMVRFSASMAEAQMKCHPLVYEVVKNFR
jgi:hypothetical protein